MRAYTRRMPDVADPADEDGPGTAGDRDATLDDADLVASDAWSKTYEYAWDTGGQAGDYAVVGDYDGYLHWLRLDTGELAARTRASRDALRAPPVVADGILVVEDTDGGLSAYRVE